jgi:hypothetical protein
MSGNFPELKKNQATEIPYTEPLLFPRRKKKKKNPNHQVVKFLTNKKNHLRMSSLAQSATRRVHS